jgi:predicted ArsR family transcriptional regulator
MRNLTTNQIATILGVEKQDCYGMIKVFETLGLIKKSGSVKADPTKRGRGEHLYQISVETPSQVALKLDTLLDAATATVSETNVTPALVATGETPDLQTAVEAVEAAVEVFVTDDKTLPGLGPVL